MNNSNVLRTVYSLSKQIPRTGNAGFGLWLRLALVLGLLSGCDFEHVGVGEWDIEIVSDQGSEFAVWTISPDGKLSIQGGIEADAQNVELVGSQIMWSLDTPSIERPGEVSQINFRGTVNGNELAGTLFTRQGNLGVYGSRRR
jgi:hypothetical protein